MDLEFSFERVAQLLIGEDIFTIYRLLDHPLNLFICATRSQDGSLLTLSPDGDFIQQCIFYSSIGTILQVLKKEYPISYLVDPYDNVYYEHDPTKETHSERQFPPEFSLN